MKNKIGLLGYKGFVGSAIALELKKKNIPFKAISRENYRKNTKIKFDYLINCSNPSKRFWAKKNPQLDFQESVQKTKYFLRNYKFKKFIHISSISARCQKNTIYGLNKKKAEKLVSKQKNYLIIRLGPMFHRSLKKGVVIDLIKSSTVFVNKKSKYSFTNLKWIAKWIINNMKKNKGIIEIGSKDHFVLESLAKEINSESKFYGKIDNQIIKTQLNFNCSSLEVLKFIKKHESKF